MASRCGYPKEEAEQRVVIEWARWIPAPGAWLCQRRTLGDFLIHPANGGSRRPVEAAIFKGLGVKPGVSDLLLALPLHGYAGLWLEMKRARGYYVSERARHKAVSAAQRAWLALMEEAGYAVGVAYGADEAIKAIENYLGRPSQGS